MDYNVKEQNNSVRKIKKTRSVTKLYTCKINSHFIRIYHLYDFLTYIVFNEH